MCISFATTAAGHSSTPQCDGEVPEEDPSAIAAARGSGQRRSISDEQSDENLEVHTDGFDSRFIKERKDAMYFKGRNIQIPLTEVSKSWLHWLNVACIDEYAEMNSSCAPCNAAVFVLSRNAFISKCLPESNNGLKKISAVVCQQLLSVLQFPKHASPSFLRPLIP
nr:hypothetical protein Iba_chr06aCG12890 [Ipomoea batatas]